MSDEFNKLIHDAFADLGHYDASMRRDRPYSGQPHTDTGIRGATKVEGVTFRDVRDCFIRAWLLSNGIDNPELYEEAQKGEAAAICEDDLYHLKGDVDPMAVCQNLCCEIERIMGIFPNVPKLTWTGGDLP